VSGCEKKLKCEEAECVKYLLCAFSIMKLWLYSEGRWLIDDSVQRKTVQYIYAMNRIANVSVNARPFLRSPMAVSLTMIALPENSSTWPNRFAADCSPQAASPEHCELEGLRQETL